MKGKQTRREIQGRSSWGESSRHWSDPSSQSLASTSQRQKTKGYDWILLTILRERRRSKTLTFKSEMPNRTAMNDAVPWVSLQNNIYGNCPMWPWRRGISDISHADKGISDSSHPKGRNDDAYRYRPEKSAKTNRSESRIVHTRGMWKEVGNRDISLSPEKCDELKRNQKKKNFALFSDQSGKWKMKKSPLPLQQSPVCSEKQIYSKEALVKLLRWHFGHADFRGKQLDAIEAVLSGHHSTFDFLFGWFHFHRRCEVLLVIRLVAKKAREKLKQ